MKVLRVINTMNPKYGGPCQGIRNSIPELEINGIINDVVCLDDPNEVFIKHDNFKIFALGKAKGPWAYNSELKEWLLLNLKNYDTVIIHGLWLYHGFATYDAIKAFKKGNPSTRIKYYVMPHGMLDPYFQKTKGRVFKALRNYIYWYLIENKVVNNADGVFFTCREELLLARIPFKPYLPKEEINIGYGIQAPPAFEDSMTSAFLKFVKISKDTPYILYLSRIHKKKGTDLLVKAYLRLKKDTVNLPKLVVAGPGLETSFGRQVVAMGHKDDDILFPGMLTGNAKWGGFYGCNAYILPSHQENFGIAVVEALACHKPVVITDQINIWREIEQSNAGIIVPDSEEGIYQGLKQLISTPKSELVQMEKLAFNLYNEQYDVKSAAITLKHVLLSRMGITDNY